MCQSIIDLFGGPRYQFGVPVSVSASLPRISPPCVGRCPHDGDFLWPSGSGAFVVARAGDMWNTAKPETFALRDAEGRGGSRHYSRGPDPWRPEDDWGPIIAAVMFLIILGRQGLSLTQPRGFFGGSFGSALAGLSARARAFSNQVGLGLAKNICRRSDFRPLGRK